MDRRRWDLSKIGLIYILYALLLNCMNLKDVQGYILEKTVSVCNGPCAAVKLECPSDHRIAIREALFGVHPLGPVCPTTANCERIQSDICCEKTPSTDCILPYPVDRLEPLHKGCSGKDKCGVNIVGNEDLAKVCKTPGTPPQQNTTYTILDYVCINDTFTADFCSEKTVTVSGRTVFAVFDAKKAKPWKKEKLCTCVAHSTTWPIENPISVFVVDIRLNKVGSVKCSDSMVSISAGKTIKDINCKSVHDPGFPYPFVSVLNSTTVALAQLVLHDERPEYVWLGFEASLDDEIRVSCGIHGWKDTGANEPVPVPVKHGSEQPSTTDDDSVVKGLPVAAIVGGFVGGAVLTIIITLIIVLAIKRRKPKPMVEPDLIEPYATIDPNDLPKSRKEPRGSVKVDERILFEAPAQHYSAPWDVKGNITDMTGDECSNDEYVGVAEVRKKKKLDKQKSRDLSSAKQSMLDVQYVDASSIRKKKLQDKESVASSQMSPNDVRNKKRGNAIGKKKGGEYDRLSREKVKDCPTPPGYDHLRPGIYMDIEKDQSVDGNVDCDESIYENSNSIRERHEIDPTKLVPGNHHDSDGGSDSSFTRNPPPVSPYELAKALEGRK